jgi:hypothetical protein
MKRGLIASEEVYCSVEAVGQSETYRLLKEYCGEGFKVPSTEMKYSDQVVQFMNMHAMNR